MMESQTNLEKKIVELAESKQTPKNSRPKIQRLSEYLIINTTNFEKYYTPKFVSIGPIHHGNTNLKLGEKYKLMWASKYIEDKKLIPEELHKKIADNIDELKRRFSDDVLTLAGKSIEGFGSLEEKLSWMLFVDGCSLLYILEKANEPGHMNIKFDQLVFVISDVVLLENQLPYEVLKLLWKDNNESTLIKIMEKFLSGSEKEEDVVPNRKGERKHTVSIPNELQPKKEKEEGEGQHSVSITNDSQPKKEKEEGEGQHSVSITNESQSETPTHLLDLDRQLNLGTSKSKICSKENSVRDPRLMSRYRGIHDLRAVGIRLKPSMNRGLTDIDFSEGWFSAKLIIPMIPMSNFFAAFLLNMIAYEMSPDFENDYGICSYVAFLDKLIDHSEDVKALRSKGILCTRWSDEEVANFFNTIGTDVVANIETYLDVKLKIDKHYNNKYKSWIGLGLRTYFNNPWTVIAFLAAFVALALTFIQTLFTIHPAST